MYLSKEEWLSAEKRTDETENRLLNLAYTTLMNNVYEADGYPWSPYRCISPARSLPGLAGAFTGVWNWDSAFHAVGVSRWDTALAKEALLGFMQFQKENGLFPDVMFESGVLVSFPSRRYSVGRAKLSTNGIKTANFYKKYIPCSSKTKPIGWKTA